MDGDPWVSFRAPLHQALLLGEELGALGTSAQPSLLPGDEGWNKRFIPLESQGWLWEGSLYPCSSAGLPCLVISLPGLNSFRRWGGLADLSFTAW